MIGHITFDENTLPAGDYVVIRWEDFAGLMQGDDDLRPRSVHFMRFAVPAAPNNLPDTGLEDEE